MKRHLSYFRLTLSISLLVGIILPLAITSRPINWKSLFTLMAMGFTLVWVVYTIILLVIVFLIRPGLKIKASRKNWVTVVRYELLNPGKKR